MFAYSIFWTGIALGLAGLGFAQPWLAAAGLAMAGASGIVLRPRAQLPAELPAPAAEAPAAVDCQPLLHAVLPAWQQNLEQVRKLLSLSEMPLVRIAQECGFSSQSHLTACFRTAHAVTPAQFRARLSRNAKPTA